MLVQAMGVSDEVPGNIVRMAKLRTNLTTLRVDDCLGGREHVEGGLNNMSLFIVPLHMTAARPQSADETNHVWLVQYP